MDSVIDVRGLDVRLDQYFGLWAVEPARFLAMFDRVSALDLESHVRQQASRPVITRPSRSGDGIAVIDIDGTLTKRGSSLSSAGSTIELRRQVRAAASDPEVGGILLCIDSPGGSVAGTADLGRDIAQAAAQKPLYAFIEDLGASAAFWLASQAAKVFANDKTALVGSIGTFIGLYDLSGAAAREGIKAVVISSGGVKGAGFPGSEITSEQKAVWQSIVDQTQAEFTAAVSQGRRLSSDRAAQLADGRLHMAQDAQSLGLIDGIQTLDETIAQLRTELSQPKKGRTMSISASAASPPQPASYQEIIAACPGADAEFICAQLKAGANAPQATFAWMGEQQTRLAAAKRQAAEAEERIAKAQSDARAVKSSPGVEPLASGTIKPASTGDAASEWNALVEAKLAGHRSKAQAIALAARENPDLHRAYLAEFNRERGRTNAV